MQPTTLSDNSNVNDNAFVLALKAASPIAIPNSLVPSHTTAETAPAPAHIDFSFLPFCDLDELSDIDDMPRDSKQKAPAAPLPPTAPIKAKKRQVAAPTLFSTSLSSTSSSDSSDSLESASQSPSFGPSTPKEQLIPPEPLKRQLLCERKGYAFMSPSIAKQEHSVYDLGMYDGSPRLVTCVRSSQGFEWSQDLFLDSYSDIQTPNLSEMMEPVVEIHLTDEEAKSYFPS